MTSLEDEGEAGLLSQPVMVAVQSAVGPLANKWDLSYLSITRSIVTLGFVGQ